VKLLRQAAGRDDRIVAAYEDVTLLNEKAGWRDGGRDLHLLRANRHRPQHNLAAGGRTVIA